MPRNRLIILSFCLAIFTFLSGFSRPVSAAEDSCKATLPCASEASVSAAINPTMQAQSEDDSICVYYFWGAGCTNCAAIKPFMDSLTDKYHSGITFKTYEIYFNQENFQLFENFTKRYKVEGTGVPAVFIGDTYLGGTEAIKNNLETKINYFLTHDAPCPLDVNKLTGATEKPKKLTLTLATVVLAALADSINPCAFAVLTFLLVYLLSIKAEKRLLKVGLTFILFVFLTYFFSGLGILKLVQYTRVSRYVALVAAGLSILAGLVSIKDFFWYGKGFSLKIPESKKPLLESYIKKASIPAAIILGFLVSAFELPCTGGIYLAILGILASSSKNISTVLYLLLYNFIFVLPLLIILLAVRFGFSPEKIEHLRLENRKWMKLIMGLIMIGLGILIISGAV